METTLLDAAPHQRRTGFRLHQFEVLNWGTFDRNVWQIDPKGENALLTGDIGSGKSTLVDAMTTLLVPAHHIIYNQAAGAERRERNLLSYVKGYYKNERDETRSAARAVSLRGDDSYSVILGLFRDEDTGQDVSLAQVFRAKGEQAPLDRFFVVADHPLTITRDFGDFGTEIALLKKRLRKESGVLVMDAFAPYAQEFRRRMDINGEQALELFYQTVSLKTVGNLTEFVRTHMLEEPPVQDRLEHIKRNFDNLNRTHEAVVKAKDQIGRLEPLISDCDECERIETGMAGMTRCRETLYAFFAGKKVVLLDERLTRLETDQAKLSDHLAHDRQESEHLKGRKADIQRSIAENGGGRLEALDLEITQSEKERGEREAREREYAQGCTLLGLRSAEDVDSFHANRERVEEVLGRTETEKTETDSRKVDLQVSMRKRGEEAAQLRLELDSLKGRTSNIPLKILEMRRCLCATLSLKEDSLPFVGELLQVRSVQADWEGAVERLLHGFGLSLLVPDEDYARVARYVDLTHLGGRLVYFRVKEESTRWADEPSEKRSLFHKIEVKSESDFHGWLTQEIIQRFDYVCCDSMEEFQREPKALTRLGQVKSQGRRHEKDDRYHLNDRSQYILGWSNEGKVRAFEAGLSRLVGDEKKDMVDFEKMEQDLKELEQKRDAARDLLRIREFQEIDWRSIARQIADLVLEKREITSESDVLRQLQDDLAGVEGQIKEVEKAWDDRQRELGKIHDRLDSTRKGKQESLAILSGLPEADLQSLFPQLEIMQAEALGDRKLTVESCDNVQTEMRGWLQARLDADAKRKERSRESLIKRMQSYKTAYPLETREVDADWEAAGEFRVMLRRLCDEDLPRHESRFKELLNKETIQDLVLFQNHLDEEQQNIKDKIDLINRSLGEIEYNPGTFIELVPEKTPDAEIREFQQQIKACLGGTLSSGEGAFYDERKFLQVKEIIDRFNGREGTSDLDQKWTRKVTDVRNWFEFRVDERWKETGEIKETYSDSSGKSGGQKEKLAYTILASALAYQFGLHRDPGRSGTFRFVMIDEAFGRGSDESARYALELFKKLDLQLLIVTPLQKIHVIEDYVRSVHFIHNEGGMASKVRNLSIETFREERILHRQQVAP